MAEAFPGTITSGNGALTLEFRSDCATTGTGWSAAWTSSTVDSTPPSTVVEALSNYQTSGFTVHFNDSDTGTGVAKRYALVSDRSDSTADWHGNSNLGYLDESFDQDAAAWTEQTGSWNRTGQAYVLTDIAQTNSNAAVALVQDSLTDYLYHWKQRITTSGTDQRAGAHFFCDNTTLPNRGNSYFVYLREGSNLAQIYEVIADSWTLLAEDTVVINENITYDVKVMYSPQSGKIRLFVNNALIVEWTDPVPLKSGNGFSLRSGSCGIQFDDTRTYRSRSGSLNIAVGANGGARYESDNGADAAKVSSIVADHINNWSLVDEAGYRIDWSAPAALAVNDGISGMDEDTLYEPVISANWSFADLNSGIIYYSYAIGTTADSMNVLPWTDAGTAQSVSYTLQDPVIGQTYFVNVRAQDAAGIAHEAVSNGQLLLEGSGPAGLTDHAAEAL